jgi:hypothetical protein
MKVEFDPLSGLLWVDPENEKEEKELYEFFCENKEYADNFKMGITTKSDRAGEDEIKVNLCFSCEQ